MKPTKLKRGRPSKFNRPSHLVALTLPDDVTAGLKKVNSDLAWAIVTLFEKNGKRRARGPVAVQDGPELVGMPDRQFLIVVNQKVVKQLAGIHVIPLSGDRAILALASGRGVGDLELAVIDLLDGSDDVQEREGLMLLRAQLREWRRDPTLSFESRAIIVAKRVNRRRAAPRRS